MVYMLKCLISLLGKEFSTHVKLNEIPIGMGPLIPNGVFKRKHFLFSLDI